MNENAEARGLPISVAIEAAAAAGRHGAGTITWERDMRITLEEFSTAREDALYSELRRIGVPESMAIIIQQPSAVPPPHVWCICGLHKQDHDLWSENHAFKPVNPP